MDMKMQMGTPWLDQPVMLHSDRTYKCSLKSPEQCTYQQGYWRFWYEADHRFALPTVGLFCAGIALFSVAFFASRLLPRSVLATGPVRKTLALNRYLSYRVFRISKLNWNSAPLGVLLLGAVGAIYFFAMTLGPQPYYWPNTKTLSYGNSPPIATRSGWLSIACLPFVFASSSKANLITAFTGISHEKLQVFHRWISYAMYVTALVHTFPFIVFHEWKGDMTNVWNTSVVYWTGVVALLAQTWLTFASISPLRNMAYECFKFTHFLAAVVFTVFFFIHCDFRLSSWDYFIATGIIFSLTWLYSQLRVFLEHGVGTRAHVSLTANGFVRVAVPTRSTWTAGQHYFIRFFGLGIHAVGSHPFTICSLPERHSSNDSKDSTMVFYIRPQGGFTKRLAQHVADKGDVDVRVTLDGPYGGCDMRKIAESDRLLAVAGGSGAGFLLPIVEAFIRRVELRQRYPSEYRESSPSLRVILVTRDLATRAWFEDEVAKYVAASPAADVAKDVNVEVYYTGANVSHADGSPRKPSEGQFLSQVGSSDPEKGRVNDVDVVGVSSGSDSDTNSGKDERIARSSANIVDVPARPILGKIVQQEAEKHDGKKIAIFGCGPLSMQRDVQNAAAAANLRLAKQGRGAGELYLHQEHFSWA